MSGLKCFLLGRFVIFVMLVIVVFMKFRCGLCCVIVMIGFVFCLMRCDCVLISFVVVWVEIIVFMNGCGLVLNMLVVIFDVMLVKCVRKWLLNVFCGMKMWCVYV